MQKCAALQLQACVALFGSWLAGGIVQDEIEFAVSR